MTRLHHRIDRWLVIYVLFGVFAITVLSGLGPFELWEMEEAEIVPLEFQLLACSQITSIQVTPFDRPLDSCHYFYDLPKSIQNIEQVAPILAFNDISLLGCSLGGCGS